MLYDYHFHSDISLDSDTDMHDMCARADALDYLGGVCFTEHLDLDYPDYDDFVIDMDRYRAKYLKACEDFPNLDIRFGIEVGYQKHVFSEQEAIIRGRGFDFIVNSVHIVDGLDIYMKYYYAPGMQAQRYKRYLELIYESVCAPVTYSVVGHMGYVARISTYDKKEIAYSDFPELIDAILEKVIQTGHGIELNTRVFETYPLPSLDIVRRYREKGGEIITLGSDAHKPSDAGRQFTEAADALRNIGFKYTCRYEQMRPIFEKLP